MNIQHLVAIDAHTHAERSCRQSLDPIQAEFDAAATLYFKTSEQRPTISATIGYRERRIGFVMFTGSRS